MGSQKKHMTIHKEEQTHHREIVEEEEREDRALILKTTKVVEYLEPLMSIELLCKFPDNSAYDFDYSQSTIWSPLVPIRTPRNNLSFHDEMMMGLELFGAKNKEQEGSKLRKKKKFITTTASSAFKLNLDFFKKQSKTKNMASDLSPTPRRRIKGACNPIINKGWAKALKAASKQFKRWKAGRDPNISHVMLPRS